MSRRSTKSKLRLATVEKSIQQLKRQYHTLQIAFINSYSFYTQTFLHRIAQKAQKHLLKFPVQALMSNIIKKFCLNELQLLFMLHLSESSKWDIHNKAIVSKRDCVQTEEDHEYKQVFLYFCLVAYATKYYLNGQSESDIFLAVLTDEIPQFEIMFEEWVQSTSDNLIVIQPIELNAHYKQLTKRETQNIKTDYNKLVEELLLISPSYKLIQNIERTKLQEIKQIIYNKQYFDPNSNKKSQLNPTKKIKLSLGNDNDHEEVNNHLGNIFQSMQFVDDVPMRQGPITRGSSCGMHEISQIGGFGRRKASSDLSKMFNLQRSSIYDWP